MWSTQRLSGLVAIESALNERGIEIHTHYEQSIQEKATYILYHLYFEDPSHNACHYVLTVVGGDS